MHSLSPHRRRAGFTLAELTVVVGVIGIAMALLLPTIQAARESSRRAQCANNLMQMGRAFDGHVTSKSCFPTAGANGDALQHFRDPAATHVTEWLGWTFQILPYLDETALYTTAKSHFEHRGTPYTKLPGIGKALVEVPIKLFWCPSRGERLSQPGSTGTVYALLDYAGLSQGQMGGQYALSFNYNFVTGALLKTRGWRGIVAKGGHYDGTSWTPWSPVRPADVTDGTSYTVALIEKALYCGQYQPAGSPIENWGEVPGWAYGAHQTTMRMTTRDAGLKELGVNPGPIGPMADTDVRGSSHSIDGAGNVDPDRDRPLNFAVDQAPGSAHRAMNALFGDGSVRSVSLQVDNTDGNPGGGLLYKLSVRDDGSMPEPAEYQ